MQTGEHLVRAPGAVAKVKGDNEDQEHDIAIARRAMEAPLREIVTNAGADPSVVLAKVVESKGNFGYNDAIGDYGDIGPDQGHAFGAAERRSSRRKHLAPTLGHAQPDLVPTSTTLHTARRGV